MDTNGKNNTWTETPAGQQLQERLTSEQTLRSIDHLLERIGTLEEAVERLSGMLQQGPGLVSMAADIADETYQKTARQGVVLEERLANALHLAERFTAPEMVEKMDRLFELMDMAPETFQMLGGVSEDVMARIRENQLKPDERIGVALQLSERLTRPEMLERLDQLLPMLDLAPDAFEMFSGILQDVIQKAQNSNIDPAVRIESVGRLLEQLTEPETVAQLEQGLQLARQLPGMAAMITDTVDEGIRNTCETGPDPLALLEIGMSACMAATQARKEKYPPMGIWSMLRAPSDPDRQIAIGFLMNFLKKFGNALREQAKSQV